MRRVLIFSISAFLTLFAVIYIVLSIMGVGSGKVVTGSDNITGKILKEISSNPAVQGMENSIILKTGAATSNPYVKAEVVSSKDCMKCHFLPSINFASSEHMAGSVKISEIAKYDDGTCGKCHDVKAVDNVSSDMEAIAKTLFHPDKFDDAKDMAGVTCIGCHKSDGDHYKKLNFTADDCGECHDKPDNCIGVNKNPIAGAITSNFKMSAHASNVTSEKFLEKAREEGLLKNFDGIDYFINSAKCLSCHQNASFKKYYAETSYYMDAAGNKYYKSFTDNNTESFFDSGVGPRAFGVTLLNDNESASGIACATCHDLHSGSLTRKDVFTSKDSLNNPIKDSKDKVLNTEARVFSAEFNLCTKCHDVKLDYEWDNKALRFDYALSSQYHDNATGVTNPADLSQKTAKLANSKIDITNANPFFYERLQGKHLEYEGGADEPIFTNNPLRKILNTRGTIIDTHFQGTIVSETVEYEGNEYILKRETVKGYNINAASAKACTSCHDSHAGEKFGEKETLDMETDFKFNADDFEGGSLQTARINKDIIALTESWAESGHSDYKSEPFLADDFEAKCMRCHSGYEAAKYMTANIDPTKLDNITSFSMGFAGEQVSCVVCHDLAQKVKNEDGTESFKLGETRKYKSDTFAFNWANEPFADPNKDIINKEDFAKIGTSASCFNCHAGGDQSARIISTFTDDDNRLLEQFDPTKYGTHFGAAAGIFWGVAAYEFPQKSYQQGSFPQHSTNTGNKDGSLKTKEEMEKEEKAYINACVDCHDFDDITHSTKPQISAKTVDASGKVNKTILGIVMTDKRKELGCNKDNCHGEDGTYHAGKMLGNKIASKIAVAEVVETFKKKLNIEFNEELKTFVYANNTKKPFTNWGKGQAGRDFYGAAANLFLFQFSDEEAYAHNPIYVKQVLWDIMEFAGGTFSNEAKKFVNAERP